MRIETAFLLIATATLPFDAAAQEPTVTQAVDKIVVEEQAEVQLLRQYSPLVETYIRLVRPAPEAQ